MDAFILWISIVGAVSIGVMTLAVFFSILGAIKRHFSKPGLFKLEGVFNQTERLNIHIEGCKTVPNVRFVGFMDSDSIKEIPYQLRNMAVFEQKNGKRVLVPAEMIRLVEEIQADETPQNHSV